MQSFLFYQKTNKQKKKKKKKISMDFSFTLCNGIIVILQKKLSLKFWRIYTFWSPLNSNILFFQWRIYVCVHVCMYVRMWANTIAFKRCIQLSSNLVCMLQVIVGRTLLILGNIGCIVFFTEVQKMSYALHRAAKFTLCKQNSHHYNKKYVQIYYNYFLFINRNTRWLKHV